jgi:two-component system response regulator QseB
VHIHALRKKLAPGVIRNIRGLGYMLESACVD